MAYSRRRAIAVLVLAVMLVLQLPALSQKKPSLTNKLGTVRQRIKQVKYKIRVKEHEKRTLTGQLAIVEARLDAAQDRLTANKMQLQDAQAVLADTTRRLAVTKKRLARHQALLETRIVDIYEGEELNYLDVVLGGILGAHPHGAIDDDRDAGHWGPPCSAAYDTRHVC